jgi:hypothetical protein
MLHGIFKLVVVLLGSVLLARMEAEALVFKTVGASQEAFNNFVLKSNQQTYTQWNYEKNQHDDREPQVQIIEFSQRVLGGSSKISKQDLEDWNSVRKVFNLQRADREVLLLLADRMQIPLEYCRYLLLEPELALSGDSKQTHTECLRSFSLPMAASVVRKVGPRDLLIIDGKAFKPMELPRALAQGEYHWRIISDQYEDQVYYGTANEFGMQPLAAKDRVQGTCSEYKVNLEDFSVLTQATVFFDDNCVVPALPAPRTFQVWAKDHQRLLWGLGILAAGFAAYQLRDKNLIITKP